MSGQWEVVSKKKEKTSKGSIQTNGKDIVKNKAQTLNVKIEDVCKYLPVVISNFI